jgi:hypothetical protein
LPKVLVLDSGLFNYACTTNIEHIKTIQKKMPIMVVLNDQDNMLLFQLIDDDFADMDHLLIGNKTVDAPKGIAKFTDLDIHLPGAGYKINFKLLKDFRVDIPYSTAVFSVQAGPIAMLRLIVQPSLMATTGEVLKTQPVLDLTDMYGNLNPGAIPTLVSVSMTPVDAKAFRGYMGGTIYGGVAESSLGVIKFTDLALFGIGAWNINFTCEIRKKLMPLNLNQLTYIY